MSLVNTKPVYKKHLRLIMAVIVILFGLVCHHHPTLASDSATQNFIHVNGTHLLLAGKNFVPRGINHFDFPTLWVSTSTQPSSTWITENDFATFQKAGFNSVRLAVKTDYFQNPNPPHQFFENGFKWLNNIILMAKGHNIRLVIDMHMPTGGASQDFRITDKNQIFWNDPWLKGRFIDTWREIARRYADEPAIWAYDIMNEPATWDFEAYKQLMLHTVSAIRSKDQNHILVIQPGMRMVDNQALFAYPQIDDKNIVRSVHFYDPIEFTHQNVYWGINGKNVISNYPATSSTGNPAWNASKILQALTQAYQKAEPDKYPVVLFEFGTVFQKINTGQPLWINNVVEAAKHLNIGWHYWYYKGPAYIGEMGLRTKYGILRPITWKFLTIQAHSYE